MRSLIAIALLLVFSQNSLADLVSRPDGHAPIGVMGDHVHKKGEVMFSVRSMYMKMKDLLDGTDTLTSTDVFNSTSFVMSPKEMTMWMHMVGAMYGVSDKLTVMTMVPYLSNDMMVARKAAGDEIEMESSGIGDISLTAMYSLSEDEHQRMQINLGVFLPTGKIDADRDGTRLGYPMQLGSGSYALQPTFNYSHFWQSYSLGSQVGFKYFLNENDSDYTRGAEYFFNVWGAYNINENISSSLRLAYKAVDPIDGSDPNLNAALAPPNSADLQHGNTALAYLGVNLLGTSFAKGHRLALEVGIPVYQDLSGPQMKTSLVGTLGWQKAY